MNPWFGVLIFLAVLVVAGLIGYVIQRRSDASVLYREEVEEPAAEVAAPTLGDRLAKTRDSFGRALRTALGRGALTDGV